MVDGARKTRITLLGGIVLTVNGEAGNIVQNHLTAAGSGGYARLRRPGEEHDIYVSVENVLFVEDVV